MYELVDRYYHDCHYDRVEIINVDDGDQRGGADNVPDIVHPSNMEV